MTDVQEYAGLSLDGSVRFYVTYNEDTKRYLADVFNAKTEVDDYGKAYIETFQFNSLQSAIEDLKHYQLDRSEKPIKI